MRRLLTLPLLAALLIPLAACQTTGSGETEVCAAWRPVTWSQRDTLETIDGVKGNNARRGAWCKG